MQLENLHIHKTGALILASVRLGGLAAGAAGAFHPPCRTRRAMPSASAWHSRSMTTILDVRVRPLSWADPGQGRATESHLSGTDGTRRGAREMAKQLVDEALDNIACSMPQPTRYASWHTTSWAEHAEFQAVFSSLHKIDGTLTDGRR